MSVSLLGMPLGFGSASDQAAKDKKTSGSSFNDLFQAASSQVKRTADSSILDVARSAETTGGVSAGSSSGSSLDLRRDAEAALGNLNRKLQQLFEEADIDTSVDIKLVGDGSGGIQLAGQHPDEDKIKELLADHPELAQQFHEMLGMFAKLQANNPQPLGASPSGVLTMIIGQQTARVAFEQATAMVE